MKKLIIILVCAAVMLSGIGFICYYELSYGKVTPKSRQQKKEKLIGVPLICQYPELPTGCEATSATMLLRFYGVDIGAKTFADKYLKKSYDFYTKDGKLYGPDPHRYFIGDPTKDDSFGCYASVIVSSVNSAELGVTAKRIIDCDLEGLCEYFIDRGEPVLIWATMNMREPKKGAVWYFKNGKKFTWTSGEHCLVLVGYDNENYIFNDPLTGKVEKYEKKLAQSRFDALGSQTVCFEKE